MKLIGLSIPRELRNEVPENGVLTNYALRRPAARGSRLLFRFELLTNLLREAPERIVLPQLLQRIVFCWIGEGFSFEYVCAAIEG